MPYPGVLHPEPLSLRQATASVLPQETLRHSSGSVSVGSLSPGTHKVLFVLSKSLFSQFCVSSGGSMVGIMVTSSKRAYAIPRSTAHRAPAPAAGHC